MGDRDSKIHYLWFGNSFSSKRGFPPHVTRNKMGCTCSKPSLVIMTPDSTSALTGEGLRGEISEESLSYVVEEQMKGDIAAARGIGGRRHSGPFARVAGSGLIFGVTVRR